MAAMRKSTGLGLAVFVAGLTLVGPQVGVAVADPGGTDGSSAATHGSRENASDVESASAGPDISRAATVDAGPASSDPDAPVPANSEDPFTDPPVSLPDLDPSGSASDTTDAPGEPALAESVVDQPAPAEAIAVESAPVAPTPAEAGPVMSAPDAIPAPEPLIAAATDHGDLTSDATEFAADEIAAQQADRRSSVPVLVGDPSEVPVSVTTEVAKIFGNITTDPLPPWLTALTLESHPRVRPAAALPVTAAPAASEDETCGSCWAFGGSGQQPTGVDRLLSNVAGVVQQVLGAALGFVNSLPANPITEFLAGALLLVHRTLFPEAVLDGCAAAAAVGTGESGPGGCGGGPLGADVTTRGWEAGGELYPGLGPMYGRSADCMVQLSQNCGGKDLAWVDLSVPSGLPRPRIETYASFSEPNMPLEEFTGGRFVFLLKPDQPVELFESDRPGPGPGLYPIARYGAIYAIPTDLNFAGATLTGANFANAYLVGADFSGADLRAANFAGADLTGANLAGANLGPFELPVDPKDYFNRWKYTNLRGAIIVDANFRGSNLQGADFSGAIRD